MQPPPAPSPEHQASASRAELCDCLARIAGGDRAALKELFDRTSAKLFGICLRILKDRGDAEDALQDVYVSVWHRAGTFDPARASPITWLATIARNRAIDCLRSLRRSRAAEPVDEALGLADSAPDAFDQAATAADATRLQQCLQELEQRQSQAIRSAFFDGFSYSQLAKRASVPLGTMKSWIRRGLQQLKTCVEA